MGERRIVASVIEMSDRKNSERDGASSLSGHHLVKRRNIQLIVDVSGGGCIEEKTRQGRNVQGAGGRRVIALAVELIDKN